MVGTAAGLLVTLILAARPGAGAAGEERAAARVVASLAGRRVGGAERTRGLRREPVPLSEVFQRSAPAVPFVVGGERDGTGIVVSLDPAGGADVITTRHVVEPPFRDLLGEPFVKLLFYDEGLGGEVFAPERVERCQAGQDRDEWCRAFLRGLVSARLVATDPERDLALLRVGHVPDGIRIVAPADVDAARPGDDVAVIGHPRGFLWTLTKGIVSAVRHRYPMGRALGTVIQTQTPVSEGSSGGPLLTADGRLLGVVSWIVPGAQGLNAAVGIDEVRAFAQSAAR